MCPAPRDRLHFMVASVGRSVPCIQWILSLGLHPQPVFQPLTPASSLRGVLFLPLPLSFPAAIPTGRLLLSLSLENPLLLWGSMSPFCKTSLDLPVTNRVFFSSFEPSLLTSLLGKKMRKEKVVYCLSYAATF